MMSAAPMRHALVGRDQQLAVLRDAWSAARGGRGQLVLLSGEPGIGKTRLAEEAEGIARCHAARVLWGRCHAMEGRPPFWPWVQILRAHALEVGPAPLAEEVDSDTLPLAHLVPELLPHLNTVPAAGVPDSDSARFRLFLGFTALLRRAARRQPLVLVLDDLHWADVTSLRLLEFLSYELAEVPILVVGTYRDVDIRRVTVAADIVGNLLRRARPLALQGFSRDEVARFVANAGTRSLAEAWASRLYEITDGNPFFLDEMVRLLETQGGSLPATGWSVPHGVLATIRQRIEVLDPEVVQLLARATVVGRELDLGFLEAALETPRATLYERLQPAIDADLVRIVADRPGRLRFAHALVHDALHAELPARQAAELHGRCGDLLATRHADAIDSYVTEIAHHYYAAASTGFDPRALEYAERAGIQAMRALAFDEAALQFGRALHLLEQAPESDVRRQCDLLVRLGEATNRAAQGPESVDAYQRAAALARQIGAPAQLARAAIGLCGVGSTWAQYGRSDPELVAVLREALDGLGTTEAGLRARVMARLATELHFAPTPEDTDALSAAAVALARSTGDPSTLAYTLPARLRCSTPDQTNERRSIIDELLALTGGRGELAVHAYVWRLSEALQAGAMAEVAACRHNLEAAVIALRQPRDLWLLPVLRSQQLLREGRLAEAEAEAQSIMEQASLSPNGRMTALVLLYLIRREQGRHGELAEGMRSFAHQSATISAWRTNLAQLYAETGATEAAQAELDLLVSEGLPSLRRDNTWLLAVSGLAGAAARVGKLEQAAILYRALQPYATRHIVAASVYYVAPVSYFLGLLAIRQGRKAEAVSHLHAARDAAQAVGAAILVAHAEAAHAEAMKLDGQIPLAEPSGARTQRRATLRRTGAAWTLTFGGRTAILKARRGLGYLTRLLAAPDREFHVLDLSTPEGEGLPLQVAGAEALLDARARQELRDRVADLRDELDEAEERHDMVRAERLRAELDAIGHHLAQAIGLGGRDRQVSAPAERARAAVTKAIRAAIRQIEEHEPDLGAILTNTIHTGAYCSYVPLQAAEITWEVDGD